MRRPLQEQTLAILLKQCPTTPVSLGASSRRNISALHSRRPQAETSLSPSRTWLAARCFSGNANDRPKSIAILGGGITGLTAAYDLSRSHPSIPVTLYESAARVGGWVSSVEVPVERGTVVFESGPRTLRPHTVNGMLTLQLAKTLGLEDDILITPKSSAAAKNRYIYYPDHLVKMPGPGQDLYEILWGMMTEPVFEGLLWAMVTEHRRVPGHGKIKDESIGDFLARRLGTTKVADNIVSAVLHGIYAGDIYQLSAQSLLGELHAQEMLFGSLSKAAIERIVTARQHNVPLPMFVQKDEARIRANLARNLNTLARWEEMQQASVYSFKGGLQTLTDRLEEQIRNAPGKNTYIRTGVKVTNISPDKKTGGVTVSAFIICNSLLMSYANRLKHQTTSLPKHSVTLSLPSQPRSSATFWSQPLQKSTTTQPQPSQH